MQHNKLSNNINTFSSSSSETSSASASAVLCCAISTSTVMWRVHHHILLPFGDSYKPSPMTPDEAMAQCRAEGRKHSSAMDMYVGALHSKLYSPTMVVEKYTQWPKHNSGGVYCKDSFATESFSDERSSVFAASFHAEEKTKTSDPSFEAQPVRSLIYTNNAAQKASSIGPTSGPVKPIANEVIEQPSQRNSFEPQVNGQGNGYVKPVMMPSSSQTRPHMGNALASRFGELDPASATARSMNMNSNSEPNHFARIHKSAEQTVEKGRTSVGSNGNTDTTTRFFKSGEQTPVKPKVGAVTGKESPNGGLIVGGGAGYMSADSSSSPTAPKEGRRWSSTGSHGSTDSCLSFGGSPTAKEGARRSSFSTGGSSDGGSPIAKDMWRRNSTGGYYSADSLSSGCGSTFCKDGGSRLSSASILNTKDNASAGIVRGMGNILGGGNTGKLKVSSNKVGCNDNVKINDGAMNKKSDDIAPNGNIGKLCPMKSLSNGNILSHGTLLRANSKPLEEFDDPEEIKNIGNEQYKKGNFCEAIALYDKSIAMCPNHAPYRSNKAAALAGLGRLAEAVQECEEAIRLDPIYVRAHQRAAHLYLRLGLIESAKRHFQSAIRHTDPKDLQSLQTVERHISKCIEARKAGNWKSVLSESNSAIDAGADSAPQVLGYKSEALLKLRRPEEAEAFCIKAQKLESSLHKLGVAPADSFVHMLWANIEISLGRFNDAIKAAESAVKIDPRGAEAAALLRKAKAVSQTRLKGNELFNSGRFFEACAAYGEGLESDPTNAVLLCNRAACRSKLGQWEKAIEDCDAALIAQPNYIKALMRRANCSMKLERWEDALRDYEVLSREMPGDMEVQRGYFDVQVAIKKSRGEEIHKMKFGSGVEEVVDANQYQEIIHSPGLSIVEFVTRWSDRCREISPFIDQLCKRYPCVHFVKVDVDDNPVIAKAENLTFVPTFKIYKNGQKLKELMGPTQQALENAIKHYSL